MYLHEPLSLVSMVCPPRNTTLTWALNQEGVNDFLVYNFFLNFSWNAPNPKSIILLLSFLLNLTIPLLIFFFYINPIIYLHAAHKYVLSYIINLILGLYYPHWVKKTAISILD